MSDEQVAQMRVVGVFEHQPIVGTYPSPSEHDASPGPSTWPKYVGMFIRWIFRQTYWATLKCLSRRGFPFSQFGCFNMLAVTFVVLMLDLSTECCLEKK